MKSEITEQHVKFSNILKCIFGKTNEAVKVIDVIRDHSNNIINNIDTMDEVLRNRKSKKGYNLFPNEKSINKIIAFFKSNLALIKELTIKAGWYKVKLFTKKAVYCITTGQCFDSMKKAADVLNCSPSGISKCCRGVRKTTANLQFKYM